MRTPLPIVALCLFATALVAQDPAVPAPASAKERLQALQQEQKRLTTEWSKAVQEARAAAEAKAKAGEKVPAMPMRPDFKDLIAQAEAAAADYAGTDDAPQFLVWIVQTSGGDPAPMMRALATLAVHHVDHPAVVAIGRTLTYLPQLPAQVRGTDAEVEAMLDRFSKSSSADVRGWALLGRHGKTIEDAARDSAEYDLARKTLLGAADVATQKDLIAELRDCIELREHLGVGNRAPEIEGEDLDGVAFKLSDYKGKVVFLDFWGDW